MINFSRKTMKREYAFILLAVLLYVVLTGDTSMAEIIVWPFLSFVATSAGLHIYDRRASDEGRQE